METDLYRIMLGEHAKKINCSPIASGDAGVDGADGGVVKGIAR